MISAHFTAKMFNIKERLHKVKNLNQKSDLQKKKQSLIKKAATNRDKKFDEIKRKIYMRKNEEVVEREA